MTTQGKNWCFTLNNFTQDEESEFQVSHDVVTYIVYGKEKGDQQTPHLQGYLEFSKNVRMPAIKKLFKCNRIHLEKRIGTADQAAAYCKKDGDVYERGTISKSRTVKIKEQKNKLLPFIPIIKEGGLQQLSNDANCNLSTLKHGQLWLSLNEASRKFEDPLEVRWFWGETGTGKTYEAYQFAMALGCEPYIRSGGGKFFDGYEGQRVAIFDDFREGDIPFNYLLRLCDKYPMRIEVKGGVRQWKPEFIFITSPQKPEEVFSKNSYYGCKDNVKQLERRLCEIREFKNPQTPQGGLKVDSDDLITPPRFHYPVAHCSPLPLLRAYCQVLPQAPSPTQEWAHLPDSD